MLSDTFLICVIILTTSKLFVSSAEFELQLINLVFRHGDRAPGRFESYPYDPHQGREYHVEAGALTDVGKRRCETLGKHLHQLYGGFVNDSYVPEEISARSTSYERTKLCARLALCVWYSEDGQLQNSTNGCRPKIIYNFRNNILHPSFSEEFQAEREKNLQLPEVRRQIDSYDELLWNLTEWTGLQFTDINHVKYLYNILACESSQNWELPDWAKNIYPPGGTLWNATALSYQLNNWTPELRRLCHGRLMRLMVDNMLAKVANNDSIFKYEEKIFLYSGHEFNVAAALITLGLWDPPRVPRYTSAVIIELLRQDHEHYVRVRFYEGIPEQSSIKTIPGCLEPCPLEQFIKLIEASLPSSEEVQRMNPKSDRFY